MDFRDKVVWVTGASSGIGEALAKGFASRGAEVILSGRRVEELERVARDLGTPAKILAFEATDYERLPALVADALSWRGRIDGLINNAGVSQRSLALDTDFDVYRRLMEIDFFAPVRLTQLVLPHMVKARCGHVAIVSSVAGKFGTPMRTGYCAAKHACVGYFDALRSEVETAYGIAVSVILPGSVQTAIAVNALQGDGSARGRTDTNIANGMPVEQAASIILDAMAAGQREVPVAVGFEAAALDMRAREPETIFARMAEEGARLAALRDRNASTPLDSAKMT